MSTLLSTDMILPAVVAFIAGYGIIKKVDIFSSFAEGAKEGLYSTAAVLPALCFLMTAVGMINQSGALDAVIRIIKPFFDKIGFPAEVLPLAIIRPFSGSGALGFYEELCRMLDPESFAAKVASVLMGGSETTFYTLAVYFGAAGIKNSRNTVPAALFADISAVILSVFAVNIFLGG